MDKQKVASDLLKIAKAVMAIQSIYKRAILQDLKKLDRMDIDPRHIEAWMRLEYGTLDSLSKSQFRDEEVRD